MRLLQAINAPEAAVLPVAMPVPGSTPLEYRERKFWMREHTPAGLYEYFASKREARAKAITAYLMLPPEERTAEASLRCWSDMHTDVVWELLQEPADGGSPAALEEVALLTHTQRAQILATQEELSGLDEALGNAADLIQSLAELDLDQVSP